MRLLDRLLAVGFLHDSDSLTKQGHAIVNQLLTKAQLIVMDNVAEFYWNRVANGPKDRIPEASDFPNAMLPFETAFIEMRCPKIAFSQVEYIGVLLQMKPRGALEPIWYSDEKANADGLFASGVEWHMEGFIFFQFGRLQPRLMSRFIVPILKDGRVQEGPKGGVFYSLQILSDIPELPKEEEKESHIAFFQSAVMPSFLALSFMHCRNVKVRTEIPPPKLSKKHQKKTGRPLLKYRVLMIDHMKQVLESEGKAGTEGLKKALHICRGHFKTYGRDGKGLLFGKHAGTVWIPMHTRGNIEEGAVVKDYSVK